jgi:hypothetical protein
MRYCALASVCLCIAFGAAGSFAWGAESGRGVQHLTEPQTPAKGAGPAPVVENDAGISLDILPGIELAVGANVNFRVSAKRQGYLILVNVNAAGNVSQIYPNAGAFLQSGSIGASANRLSAGQTMTIPQTGNSRAANEFVVPPPPGIAMAVAILSDRPVEILDLPDVPVAMAGRVDALNYLMDVVGNLQLSLSDKSVRLAKPKWSFAARFYVVK